MINNEFLIEQHKLSDLKKISDSITEKYKNNTLDGKKLLTTANEALVYALVRMPATYEAVRFALNETFKLYNDSFLTALDIGAGTGAGSLALKELFPNIKITCIERESEMLKLGKRFLPDEEWINLDINNYKLEQSYDIILASYVINELNEILVDKLLSNFYDKANKLLILIDAGSKKNSKIINLARNFFIEKGGYIVAPCISNVICQNAWCHFSCRVERNKIHRYLKGGDLSYEDEKFSFISIAKEKVILPCYRVTRHPTVEKDKISLELCSINGIIRKFYKKKDANYKLVKKLKWGNAYNEYTDLRQK